ncbi:MAG: hypothetical protein H0W14_06735 [Actinobacteria bacterium]|nr:hypothetical protein [Actinomycetota bacterium]
MDIHPWTNYEIARLRDEERLQLARAAMRSLELRENHSGDPEPPGARSSSFWLDRIRRRETATS